MDNNRRRSRILGWAFVYQFVTSFTSMAIFLPLATGVPGLAAGSVDIGPVMSSLAANTTFAYLNILGELLTAAGVIFLGALLYQDLKGVHEALAKTAWGLYVVEAALLAAGRIVLYALLLVSQEGAASGSSTWEPVGRLLFGTMAYTSTVLNVVFCVGAGVFYSLLFRSALVPKALALWGLVGVLGVLVGTTISLLGGRPSLFLFLPYVPFELGIGLWILFRGLKPRNLPKEKP